MSEKLPPSPGLDAYHRERSKCIDAFAALETATLKAMDSLEIKFAGESFGQKIGKLGKAKPTPKFSQARLSKLMNLAARLAEANALRNDIIHSRLQVTTLDDGPKAMFVNTRHCLSGSQTARLFSLAGLRDTTKSVGELAAELAKI